MKNKKILYIITSVIAIIVISAVIYLAVTLTNKPKSPYYTKNVTITKYEDDNKAKTLEITDKRLVNKLIKICDNMNFNQDEKAKKLSIKNDVKVDLQNGTIFYIQKGLEEYCYIETGDIKKVILIPEGLYNYVNENLPEE